MPVLQLSRKADVLPDEERAAIAPTISAIEVLKKERNAVILAHNYMTPDIYHTVADLTGDSLALARMAVEATADVIVMAGVHFMAETAKLLNPEKTVLIPDLRAGCSLAEGITGADVRRLRAEHPGVPVVTYVNTSAEVKAESDICCTSGNARDVVESLGTDKVIFAPDQYLGAWVASQTNVEVILWKGSCMVHERFTGEEIRLHRESLHSLGIEGLQVIAHPECPPDVLAEADFVGSTYGMQKWVTDNQPRRVMMITECSMADNVASVAPDTEFIRPCNLCPHMKRITLHNIKNALELMQYEVEIEPDIADRARSGRADAGRQANVVPGLVDLPPYLPPRAARRQGPSPHLRWGDKGYAFS